VFETIHAAEFVTCYSLSVDISAGVPATVNMLLISVGPHGIGGYYF